MAATTADELYENAACGLLTTDAEGMVQRVNRTLLDGMGLAGEEVERHRFDSLLTAAGRLFAETRFLPVLRLEGRGDELALELRRADGGTLPALVNAIGTGTDGPVHVAIFEAPQRRDYERELLQARRGAERSEAGVRVLQATATSFADTSTREAVAEALADAAGSAFDAADCAVLLIEDRELRIGGGRYPLGDEALLE